MDPYRPYREGSQTENLEQGDLLYRTPYLEQELLGKYHPYYADRSINEFFAVLTQACDLVRRSGVCKARYISLAPVRPLREITGREFEGQTTPLPGGLVSIGSSETKERLQEFLRRLFNNNDPRYFFLPQQPELGISEDYCVVLPLAISVKVEHYGELLRCRKAQITDLYQAKFGWLLGQQFSRVGTPDWPTEEVDRKAETVALRTSTTWLPEKEYLEVRKAVRALQASEVLDEDAFVKLRKTIPSRIDTAIDALFKILVAHALLPADKDPSKPKLRNALKNDPLFSSFFRN